MYWIKIITQKLVYEKSTHVINLIEYQIIKKNGIKWINNDKVNNHNNNKK